MNNIFSWSRLAAIIIKEFIQIRRDRMTFAMIVGIPLIQLLLFGYAINSNPKYLPTVLLSADHSIFTRDLTTGMKNSNYFRFIDGVNSEAQANHLLVMGKILFVVNIPAHFTRDLVRGLHPHILLTTDATDPIAVGQASVAMNVLMQSVFNKDLRGPLAKLKTQPPPVKLIIHNKYNPESITQYNIVPGLLGVILTMTMVIITSLAITRERERGTIESLLATPVRPLEVMLGKITPYIVVGYLQVFLILLAARFLFHVPMQGSLVTLSACIFLFILANLAVGIMFSTVAKNQLQAMQMTFFFFLPSILLSGFMFPFYGMPQWAQWLGSVLPLTHFLRIVRGILLKGSSWLDLWPSLWPILLFCLIVMFIAVKRYRQTLD